jgi:alkylhydroperoxidase family enzyme
MRTDKVRRSPFRARFTEPGLIELVTVIGFYSLVSLSLNAFDVEVPDDMVDSFPEAIAKNTK